MYGKALPVGTDRGSFSVENPPLFNNFHRVFNTLCEKPEKEAWKSVFLQENCVENAGKTVEYPFFPEKPVENYPFFTHCTAN